MFEHPRGDRVPERVVDLLARHGELQVLHLGNLRVGIDSHEGRPGVAHRVKELALDVLEAGNPLPHDGGAHRGR